MLKAFARALVPPPDYFFGALEYPERECKAALTQRAPAENGLTKRQAGPSHTQN
ncbi:hypothetical protein [Cupriavidus necator]|uniref:hypothetical protein n=1 Tax=Cupriavidus necator TaxID=106590 RepID=UPI0014906C82|nr:hypothetical protein [Cupriavidus necator]